ncbi:DNA primase [Porphyromonas pogonae]|uniref:DNA primase n=1 Tax=Porphyromonas pogonae TaxID=867595 RepID=UPI002E762B49|nr:DNA primase [Porphyromonas pogonae]
MIDPITKQRIIDAANIVDVVSDFVSLRKKGVSYVGLCPFHSDRSPSFYVSPSKNICKCFSCGEGGSPLHFIMKHEQLSYTEALKYLAKKYNIEVQEREETDEEKREANERESLFIVNEFAKDYFHKTLLDTEDGRLIGLSYFTERGIRPDTIEKFNLGYCTDSRHAFSDQALKSGFSTKALVDSGLAYPNEQNKLIDRFRGRVIFPVQTISGKFVAFGGRILSKKDKVAKYVNSPESLIYSKSKELYGLFQAKKAISKEEKCFLVEGYTDVISMHQSGIENVVSSSGTALTVQQIRLIRRFSENVTVLYDGDAAGIKAALRGIDLLLEEGLHIKVVLLPDGEDPDSYARSHSATEFKQFIKDSEVDFITFKTQLLLKDVENDPLARAQLINDVIKSISLIPEPIERAVYIQNTSQQLNMDEQLIFNEVKRLRIQRGMASHPQPAPAPTIATSLHTENNAATPDKQEIIEALVDEGPYRNELELIRMIIKYGDEDILVKDNEDSLEYPIRLAAFVKRELDSDDIEIGSTIFTQILNEAVELIGNEDIKLDSYFVNHHNEKIRSVASDLISDKYLLSKVHKHAGIAVENELEVMLRTRYQRAVREIYAIKNAYIIKCIDEVRKEIMEAQQSRNNDLIIELMQELVELNSMKAAFAQALGDRTII